MMIFFNVVADHAISVVASEITSKPRKQRGKNKVRLSEFWEQGLIHWNDKEFKQRMRVSRQIFKYTLTGIGEYIEKTPTNPNPAPTPTHVQLALTLYRLGHGFIYPVVANIFVVSKSLTCQVFNHLCRILVARLYNKNVYMPSSGEKWQVELRGFIKNYEFPCAGALDGYHIYTTTKFKQYHSFKKRCSVLNMGLVSYNKRFLHPPVEAPGSTHDSRLLKNTRLYQ